MAVQRRTIHLYRNLLARAPKHMHEDLGNGDRDMIYADTAAEGETQERFDL